MALVNCTECGNKVSSTASKCPHCGTWAPGGKGKSVLGVMIIFLVLFLLLKMTAEDEQPPHEASGPAKQKAAMPAPAVAGEYSLQHKKIQDRFRSKEEPTAKDAIWTSPDIFKVGVLNDGSQRDGYADYVCQILYQQGFQGKHIYVQIIDIAKLQRDSEWVKLGEKVCE